MSPSNDRFFVKAILKNEELIGPWTIIMSLEKSQEFLSLENAIHQIIIAEKSFKTAKLIQEELQETFKSEESLEILSWQEVAKEFYASMIADKKGNEVTLIIIVFMAILTVLNTVLMAVLERIPEFGLLRALGTKSSQVVSLIFLEILLVLKIIS